MKLLTNLQYDAICDIVIGLQKENEKLKEENQMLSSAYESVSRQLNECFRVLSNNNLNIDFPNSHRKENNISSWV